MKHKSTKRTISNKHPPHYALYQQQTRRPSSPHINTKSISSHKVDLGTGTVHLDSHSACLKPKSTLKSQKALKRDLLRCSDQRPSLLGPHTLQPPRVHHGSQQTHTTASSATSSTVDHHQTARRHSLTVHSHTFYTTLDRIGPWPDVSISRLRSDGNELLRPLKNFRNLKNPRVFSPKYYAALSENTTKFKFYSSTRSYIDEYRKKKGYLLGTRTTSQVTPLSFSTAVPIQPPSNEHHSVVGTMSSDIGQAKDRMISSTIDLSLPQNRLTKSTNDLFENINIMPSIPSVAKVFNESTHINHFPTIAMRNGHLRPTRYPLHPTVAGQQPVTLPSLTGSSLHYISSMNSVEKAYSNSKKPLTLNQSKLYFIDGRNKRRISQRMNSDSEIASRSQDLSELQATGGPVVTTKQRSAGVVVYQLPRRPPPMATSLSDVGSLS